ncbi:MAG: hypothetical protein GY754_05155 [bacterium]|nr:hypothetical protein [bacterium]
MKAEKIEFHVLEKEEALRNKIKSLLEKNTSSEIAKMIDVNRTDLSAWMNKKREWEYRKILKIAKKVGL